MARAAEAGRIGQGRSGRARIAAVSGRSSKTVNARETLLDALRTDGLVIGEVTLASGRTAQYYVDARRALLRPAAFRAAGELVAAEARRMGAAAVGGPTLGADPWRARCCRRQRT